MATSIATTGGALYAAHHWGYSLVASSPAKVVVPSLTGLSEADAKTNLEALGLRLMVAGREPDPTAQDGAVIAQEPRPDVGVAPGDAVRLTFAIALPKVPNVVGKTLGDATSVLEQAGYAVRLSEPVPSPDLKAGMVVSQVPEAQAPLALRETVSLQPAAGEETIEVPKFLGLGMDSAKAEAEKVGVELVVQWVALAETPTNIVLRQDPAPGEKVLGLKKVTVFINSSR